MSIQLDLTDSITFERPLTRVVKKNVRIENPNSKPVAFKVKTTAPRLYCVRPNSDIIQPNSAVDVQIMLQAFREEPPVDAKCKDKFLILSTFVNETTENLGLQELWSHVEENDKGSIHQRKLRCIYGQPSSNEVENQEVNITTETVTTVQEVENIENQQTEDVAEKMRKMEEELNKYKKQVETLREGEPSVVEKVQVKQTGYPLSIIIFLALLVAAIAYFVKV